MPIRGTCILLSGERGVGKTTVCLRLRERAAAEAADCGGVLTLPLLDAKGGRLGLELLDASRGERRLFASCLEDLGGPRIGIYSMRQATLDWGVDLVRRALRQAELVFLDEVGPLELDPGGGFAPLWPDLARPDLPSRVIVVRPSLLERVRPRMGGPAAAVLTVTPESREALPGEILRLVLPPDPFPDPPVLR